MKQEYSGMYQNCYVELADGRIGLFSGPVLVGSDGEKAAVKCVSFSQPKELPPDIRWDGIEKIEFKPKKK